MPQTAQTKKRVIQASKANDRNRRDRSSMRTNIKSLLTAIQSKDTDTIRPLFIKIQSLLDILAKKNVIPKNRASRLKSRLNAKVKAAS
ncbi:30S ribosomal protein S20 [Candidatus Synchoanobacter obligatus]|uniref:Small ribosomal subunit protein bS20 n=1 Tax=Candidatus Synchoanobacter obligatus TaxID=2919597 RepID=A0ABT1L5F6_9GAMM|nr:30S ribosomal protein S20 [Candidatus Synchoanobacter obligatus]MCP8352407.1 30S ribosomal protein S20 [Candidatus Synchoanobacter obligatus]